MNDLVDHHLTKLKLLMLTITMVIMGKHGRTLIIITLVTVNAVGVTVIVIIIQSTNTRSLANTAIALGARPIVFPTEIERLEEEEDGNLDDSQQQENNLNCSLTRVESDTTIKGARLQEHVDQHVQESRRLLASAEPIDRPLIDNAENEVTEDGLEEDHARDEVTPDIDRLLEVTGVDVREAQRVGHVGPTQDDRHLHLVTVAEEQIVLSTVPAPVETKGVAVTVGFAELGVDRVTILVVIRDNPFPLTVEERHGLGEHIVVDETGVNREDSHDQSDVTTIVHHGEELERDFLQGLLPVDHGEGGAKHDDGMTKVTEHDGKQEGESNNNRDGRVDFLVGSSTVGVDDCLESLGELVGLEVRRRGLVGPDLVDNGRNRKTSPIVDILQSRPDEWQVVGRTPTLSNQRPASPVVREEVESVIDSLLLANENHPGRKRLRDLRELSLERLLSVAKDVLDIVKSGVDLVNLVPAQIAVLIDIVHLGAHGLGNAADLGEDLLAVGKDNEDVLENRLVGGGIDQRLGDLGLVHVKVTTEGTPKDALKGSDAVSADNTGDETDVHAGEGALDIGGGVVLLDILQQRGVVVVGGCSNLLDVAVGAVEEAASLTQDPSRFGQLDLALLQCFVALVKRRDALLQALGTFGKFVDLGGGGRGEGVYVEVEFAKRDSSLLHLGVKVALAHNELAMMPCGWSSRKRTYAVGVRHCRGV